MVQPNQVLNSVRVNAVFQGFTDPRLLPQPLVFSERVVDQDADDGEIMGSFTGYIQIADLIADDQRAAVYSAGKWSFESTNIPNLKVGQSMTQAMLNQLAAMRGLTIPGFQGNSFEANENRILLNVRTGVAWRRESLIIGMYTDSFDYDRLGIKLTGATWGMPSDLKVTLTGTDEWSDTTNADPVEDIFLIKRTGSIRYGVLYNRMTMSTPAFEQMINTTKFQNKARMYLAPNVSFVNLNTADLTSMQTLAERVTGMQIVLYDARYMTQNSAGDWVLAPFLALNKVVFDSATFDRNPTIMDFANGIVTESVVAELVNNPAITGGPQAGPLAYVVGNPSLDPPNVTYYGVQRGFPRKHTKFATACLTIGTVTDTIPPTVPF